MTDLRIIDFSKPSPVLPKKFKDLPEKRMIYAAGDGRGGFYNRNSRDGPISNIEFFVNYEFNIFCFLGPIDYENINTQYLLEHPELNIVVCVLTMDYLNNFRILQELFKSSISLIDTDDQRTYPDSKTAFTILIPDGICIHVHKYFTILGQDRYEILPNGKKGKLMDVGISDFGWGEPNFTLLQTEGNAIEFKKHGNIYVEEANQDYLQEERRIILQKRVNANSIYAASIGGKRRKLKTRKQRKLKTRKRF